MLYPDLVRRPSPKDEHPHPPSADLKSALKAHQGITKEKEAEPAARNLRMNPIPEARGPLLRVLLHFARRLVRLRLLRFVLTAPISLRRWGPFSRRGCYFFYIQNSVLA